MYDKTKEEEIWLICLSVSANEYCILKEYK